jgi:hypothetical protein
MTAPNNDEPLGLEPSVASPLDRPLNPTYVGVIAVEFVVIVLLVIIGKIFS